MRPPKIPTGEFVASFTQISQVLGRVCLSSYLKNEMTSKNSSCRLVVTLPLWIHYGHRRRFGRGPETFSSVQWHSWCVIRLCHSTSTNTSGLIKRHPRVISTHNRFRLLRFHQKKTCEDEDESWSNASVGEPPLTECSPMNRMHTVKRDQLQLYTHRSLEISSRLEHYLESNPITYGCLNLPDFIPPVRVSSQVSPISC
jgi:hypothetical protein